jgi:hypothetical protein
VRRRRRRQGVSSRFVHRRRCSNADKFDSNDCLPRHNIIKIRAHDSETTKPVVSARWRKQNTMENTMVYPTSQSGGTATRNKYKQLQNKKKKGEATHSRLEPGDVLAVVLISQVQIKNSNQQFLDRGRQASAVEEVDERFTHNQHVGLYDTLATADCNSPIRMEHVY